MPPRSCVVCGKECLLRCNCATAPAYCSKDCQKLNWKIHKSSCTAHVASRDPMSGSINFKAGTSVDFLLNTILGDPKNPAVARVHRNLLKKC